MTEEMTQLPKGWRYVPLTGSVFFEYLPTGVKLYEGEKEYYSTGSIKGDAYISEGRYTFLNRPSRANRIANLNDIFQARMKGTNKVVVASGELSKQLFSTGFIQLRANPELSNYKYLAYFLSSKMFLNQKDDLCSGSTQSALNDTNAENILVPLPPLETQQQIVEKIETLFSELDNSVANLKAAKAQLKRYRQSILKSAFEGNLTAAWREANADKLETAETLMDRIKVEREGAYASKSRKPKEISPLTDDEVSELSELPNGWGWVKVGEAFSISGGLTKNATREKMVQQVPFLRVANVYSNELKLDDIHTIGISDTEMERVLLQKNDILIVEGNGSGDQIGRMAIWNGSIKGMVHQNHLIKARPSLFVNPKYCLYFFQSMAGRELITRVATSTSGLFTLNLFKVENLLLPIVGTAEQHQIVNEIESRLSEADVMERTINESLIKAEKMRQSILKKAFEGKLVLQDKPVVESTIQVKQLSSTDLHAGIIALTMKLHEGTPHQNKLNHVKCEKIAHLCEALVGIELGRTPVQDAAGPDDYPHLKKVEHRANMAGWFHIHKESIGHTYQKGRNFNVLVESARSSLGTDSENVEKLLHLMLPMDMERAEIFATTYAAWNNLLMDGKQPDHNEIVQSAREEWSSRKMNIDRERFYKAIEWMTKVGIVPMGQGKYVKPMKVKK